MSGAGDTPKTFISILDVETSPRSFLYSQTKLSILVVVYCSLNRIHSVEDL